MAEAKRIRQEITGVVSILGAIYICLSLATYSKWDPSFFVFTTVKFRSRDRKTGGGGGIRTHGRVTPTTIFKTVAFNRSATPPQIAC